MLYWRLIEYGLGCGIHGRPGPVLNTGLRLNDSRSGDMGDNWPRWSCVLCNDYRGWLRFCLVPLLRLL